MRPLEIGMTSRLRHPIALAALAILVRVPFLRWPLISDEGSYAYNVYWWLRGYHLYVDLLGVERPQGLFLAYCIPVQFLGGATWTIRLWGAAWIAATVLVVYACARLLLGERYAPVPALVYALYSAMPYIEGFTANAETFMVLPLALSAYALLKRHWFVAGLAAGCAVAFKASGVAAFALAVGWLLFTRAGWRAAARFGAGVAPILMAMLAHGVWSAGWQAYLYNLVLIRRHGFFQPYGSAVVAALVGWIRTAPAWLPLAVLLPAGLRIERPKAVFLLLWLLSSLLGMSLSGHWYWHYWIQLMPPLSIAAAAGLVALWDRRRVLSRILVIALLLLPLLATGRYLPLSPRAGSEALYHRLGYLIAEDVAAYIRSHTREDESVYVAFAQADIYYLSARRAAVPYLFYAYVVSLPGAYERIVAAVAQRLPTYVLALDSPIKSLDPQGRFWKALHENYVEETTFRTAVLYRRRE